MIGRQKILNHPALAGWHPQGHGGLAKFTGTGLAPSRRPLATALHHCCVLIIHLIIVQQSNRVRLAKI
jgi:hypothetical protein